MAANDDHAGQRTLAEKITALIAARWPDERKRPGVRRIARQIAEASGGRLTGSYLWNLANGQSTNPTVQQVESMAKFFGVPPAYFFDDGLTEEIHAEGQLLSALRDRGVLNIALRTDGLSAASRQAIVEMIDRAREIERLDPIDATDEHRSE